MTFKPTTYLLSFAAFVLLFMGLGGYLGFGRIREHFLVQAFLQATPLPFQVRDNPAGGAPRWEALVPLPQGGPVHILAQDRTSPLSLEFSNGSGPGTQVALPVRGLAQSAQGRLEDLRIDQAGRRLYARVLAASEIKSKETVWLCEIDLQDRRLLRSTAVNPILLPAAFRP